MDYNDKSVGICYCCMFFTFKHYIYFMMFTNGIQGIVLILIGLFGILEQFELFVFQKPIIFCFLGVGGLVILGILTQLFFFLRHSVIFMGRFMVIVNILTSLFDLFSGVILLLSCFIELSFIEFNESQLTFSSTRRTIILIISIGIIIISLYGFWMTYLQHQTIHPLQEIMHQETRVAPTISLRQAIVKKFTKNFIGELTPNNGKTPKQGDTTSENSQPAQRAQVSYYQMKTNKINQDEIQEPYSRQRSEKLIRLPDTNTPENEQYFAPTTNTIRTPNQQDEIQHLRKQRTPRVTQLRQPQY